VWRWVDPKAAQRLRENEHINRSKQRWDARRATLRGNRRATVPYQEARAVQLVRRANLSPATAAKVMRFDFPDGDWSRARVVRLLRAA